MSNIKNLLQVSESEKQQVRKSYNKSEEDIQQDLNILLDWLQKQPHLPHSQDLNRLERFLLRNKFRIEITKIKLDKYYTYRGIYSDFLIGVDPSSVPMQNLRKSIIVTPLPKLSPLKERILICQFVQEEAENFNLKDFFSYLLMICDLQISSDYAVGDRYICDLSNLTFKHCTKMDPATLSKGMAILQEAFSGRITAIDYVHQSPAFDVLFNLAKSVLSAKLISRVKLHKNLDSLYEVVPKEYLPKDYEGYLEPVSEIHDKWGKELEAQTDFLTEIARTTSNEKLRIGKPIHNEMFGIEGTFKKINLD